MVASDRLCTMSHGAIHRAPVSKGLRMGSRTPIEIIRSARVIAEYLNVDPARPGTRCLALAPQDAGPSTPVHMSGPQGASGVSSISKQNRVLIPSKNMKFVVGFFRNPCDEREAMQRWENEGGSDRAVDPFSAHVLPPSSDRDRADVLDARQDELMSIASSDGRPPSHRNRRLGWRGFGKMIAVALPCAFTWAILTSQSPQVIVAPLVVLVVISLFLAVNPVLWAGIMRGTEERTARRIAVLEEPLSAQKEPAIVVMMPESESAAKPAAA